MESNRITPLLFPYEPDQFWEQLRCIVREEVDKMETKTPPEFETPGLTYKPLYKIAEVCVLLRVSRPTIYEWIRLGKLKPYKIQSRLYFLWNDIQELLHP